MGEEKIHIVLLGEASWKAASW